MIDKFRQQNIYLDDPPSIITASHYIFEKHEDASVDSIDRYVSNLRQLLRCPPDIIPANPSITDSLPAWATVGDQVDVPLKINGRDEIWHGVVVSTGVRSCHIYWVGCPAYAATKRQKSKMDENPVKVDRRILRWHQHGSAREGDCHEYSVSWIKCNYISKSWGKPPEVVVVNNSDTDDKGGEQNSEEDRLKQKPAPPPAGKGKRRGRGKGAKEISNVKKKPKEGNQKPSSIPDPSLRRF